MDRVQLAEILAVESGHLLADLFKNPGDIDEKSRGNLVSAADLASEKAILEGIRQHFPDDAVWAEESGQQSGTSGYQWVVDPLDSTASFVTGKPYFSVSIAVLYQGETVIGCVRNPILDQTFQAQKGKGATVNGVPMAVTQTSVLKNAIVAFGFDTADDARLTDGINVLHHTAGKVKRIMVNSSPALDLCYVAMGKLDALVDLHTAPEDHAAGSLMVQEAGGSITNFGTQGFDVWKLGAVACGPNLVNQIVS